MSRERLLVARAAEMQLMHATELLRKALGNLAALQYGVQPSIECTRKALGECERATSMVENMIKRIPE